MISNEGNNKYRHFVLAYTVITILVFSSISSAFFFTDFSKAKPLGIVLIIIGALLFTCGYIIGSVLLWKYFKKKLNKDLIDWVIVVLISSFISLSLIVAALTTKFSSNELSFDKLDRMTQITWVVFGVSITLYSIIIGFISSSNGNSMKSLLSDFTFSLYPVFCTLVPLIISTIMVYCFYDNNILMTTTLSHVSFVAGIFNAPYCLLLSIHFLSKTMKTKSKD